MRLIPSYTLFALMRIDLTEAEQYPRGAARPQAHAIANLQGALEFHVMAAFAYILGPELRQVPAPTPTPHPPARSRSNTVRCRSSEQRLLAQFLPVDLALIGKVAHQNLVDIRIERGPAACEPSAASSSSLRAVPT
jgi:hypothetical protein